MIEKAKAFATEAHKGQKRKIEHTDYIVHPTRVAEQLKKHGYKEEVICAGYLHDVVEDTANSSDDILREFGEKTAALVAANTEDKSKSWQERKQHTIEIVKEGSPDVKALIVADKLDNLQSMKSEFAAKGKAAWAHFNAGYDKQKWYYESIMDGMEEGLQPAEIPSFFEEYRMLVKQTFE